MTNSLDVTDLVKSQELFSSSVHKKSTPKKPPSSPSNSISSSMYVKSTSKKLPGSFSGKTSVPSVVATIPYSCFKEEKTGIVCVVVKKPDGEFTHVPNLFSYNKEEDGIHIFTKSPQPSKSAWDGMKSTFERLRKIERESTEIFLVPKPKNKMDVKLNEDSINKSPTYTVNPDFTVKQKTSMPGYEIVGIDNMAVDRMLPHSDSAPNSQKTITPTAKPPVMRQEEQQHQAVVVESKTPENMQSADIQVVDSSLKPNIPQTENVPEFEPLAPDAVQSENVQENTDNPLPLSDQQSDALRTMKFPTAEEMKDNSQGEWKLESEEPGKKVFTYQDSRGTFVRTEIDGTQIINFIEENDPKNIFVIVEEQWYPAQKVGVQFEGVQNSAAQNGGENAQNQVFFETPPGNAQYEVPFDNPLLLNDQHQDQVFPEAPSAVQNGEEDAQNQAPPENAQHEVPFDNPLLLNDQHQDQVFPGAPPFEALPENVQDEGRIDAQDQVFPEALPENVQHEEPAAQNGGENAQNQAPPENAQNEAPAAQNGEENAQNQAPIENALDIEPIPGPVPAHESASRNDEIFLAQFDALENDTRLKQKELLERLEELNSSSGEVANTISAECPFFLPTDIRSSAFHGDTLPVRRTSSQILDLFQISKTARETYTKNFVESPHVTIVFKQIYENNYFEEVSPKIKFEIKKINSLTALSRYYSVFFQKASPQVIAHGKDYKSLVEAINEKNRELNTMIKKSSNSIVPLNRSFEKKIALVKGYFEDQLQPKKI